MVGRLEENLTSQGEHQPGKPGKVRKHDIGGGKLGVLRKNGEKVWEIVFCL